MENRRRNYDGLERSESVGSEEPLVKTRRIDDRGLSVDSDRSSSVLSSRKAELLPADRYEIVQTRANSNVGSKQGVKGDKIHLQTNFFELLTPPGWQIYRYEIATNLITMPTRLVRLILSEQPDIFGAQFFLENNQLFLIKRLSEDPFKLKSLSEALSKYTIDIRFIGVVEMTDWRSLHVLSHAWQNALKYLNLEMIGSDLYDPSESMHVQEHSLTIWPGYETIIRQHEQNILFCTEMKHKVMRMETVYNIYLDLAKNPTEMRKEFVLNVMGIVVLTDYNNKVYRINDVDFTQTPCSTFNCKGANVTYLDYYQRRYNIHIRDPHQPLLVSINKKSSRNPKVNKLVMLIPELCRVTGITTNMRRNFRLMTAVTNATRMNPRHRVERLMAFNMRIQNSVESVKALADWNIRLDTKVTECDGRLIEPQRIVFRNNRCTATNGDWTRTIRNEKFLTSPPDGLRSWVVMAPRRNLNILRNFVENLQTVAFSVGLETRSPKEVSLYDDAICTYEQAIDDCLEVEPQMIFCLVPTNNTDRYSAIKKRGYVNIGIPIQVVTLRAAQTRNLSCITFKVATQMNCKMGYVPWMVELPLGRLMTIGFDLTKSTRDHSKYYSALVASMDLQKNFSFFSTAAEGGASNLWPMMRKALNQYKLEHDGTLPARILIYRASVQLGTLGGLVDGEVQDVVGKLNDEYKNCGAAAAPMIAFVVVSNTKAKFCYNGGNPPPGTVVDDVVTQPESFDFYLISHGVREGTVTPTRYNVVYSNIRLTPDQLQKLTFKMCHLYYNWSSSISVPAVCQYAKKLANLVATNLHAIPNESLEKKLYYI